MSTLLPFGEARAPLQSAEDQLRPRDHTLSWSSAGDAVAGAVVHELGHRAGADRADVAGCVTGKASSTCLCAPEIVSSPPSQMTSRPDLTPWARRSPERQAGASAALCTAGGACAPASAS